MQHAPLPPLPPDQRRIAEAARRVMAALEARQLDVAAVRRPALLGMLHQIPVLWRIERLARFWENADGHPILAYERVMQDLLSGLSAQHGPLLYLLWNNGQRLHVAFGSSDTSTSEHVRALLIGLYPGIKLQSQAVALPVSLWNNVGALSGIPALKGGRRQQDGLDDRGDVRQIERLPRGLARERWAYLVLAEPVDGAGALAMPNVLASLGTAASSPLHIARDTYLEAISFFASAVKRNYDTVAPLGGDPTERTDRVAQRNVELLELALQRAEVAKAEGSWRVHVCYGAEDAATFQRLLMLVRSSFAGDERAPQPLRVHECAPEANTPADAATTMLTSRELARYCTLPQEEFPGYQVIPYTRFSVAVPASTEPDELLLDVGALVDGETWLAQRYTMPLKQLTTHVLVAGATGSGKTNTCLHLLVQLGQERIPFLVIEPVNATHNEYRSLAHLPLFNQQSYRLQIFTLGDEETAPFAFNPLEIEAGTTPEAHISRLLTCFKAGIPMWQPLPAVFLRALQRTYIKAGFLPGERVRAGQAFPTVRDFSYELADVAAYEIQHGDEARANIIGGSVLRIQALLEGGAGRVLTARRSIPTDELLTQPTILELRHVGDDNDKALLIGLLLMRLTAAMERRGPQQRSGRPAHVILIEEAHRLLAQTAAVNSSEQENARGETAQAFAHLLAETRKYGQGVIIAEQLPVKLVRDAIGNTGLKLMHLLTAKEDRDVLAAAMRLTGPQADAVASLPPGQLVAFTQGQAAPVRVAVPNVSGRYFKRRDLPLFDDAAVRQHMARITNQYQGARLPFKGCDLCQAQCRHRPLGDAVSRLREAREAAQHAFAAPNTTPHQILTTMLQAADQFALQPLGGELPKEARYCAALHLTYATQQADTDRLELWRDIRSALP